MKSMMSHHNRNSKGLESSSGQAVVNHDVIIKIEPAETCSSTSTSPEISQAISTGHLQTYHQLGYPSMVSRELRRYHDHSQKQQADQGNLDQLPQDKIAFDCFKNQIIGSIKLEFPNTTDEEAYHIAAKRWDVLSEEQKRSFVPKGVQLDGRGSNLSMSRLRGVHYDVAGSEDNSNYGNDRSAAKYGKCTWCHRFGTLNDYSSNLQGREIYCTGLCSKDCFEQAALKILNVEAGYGLESSSFPESLPIRTSLENISHDSRDRRKQSYEQLQYDGISHIDATRYRSARGCDALRPFPVVTTPPASLPFPTTPSIVPMWNIENVKSVSRTERTRTPKQENSFQWNEYVRRTGSTVAPLSCFRQQNSGPNLFQIGMKLELKNPKDESNYCLATVVNVIGPRLHMYLDGCSNRDDIWLLYDSCELHPIGWCKENGLEPKQPKGFSIEGENYAEFVQRTLKDAKKAPLNAFQDEPAPPKENGFSPGMKLEAVNKLNPSVIGVATVLDIDEDRIRIQFDGYKGSGYWTTYRDRDLFNAGWCFKNGHPLRPPASQVIRLEGINPYNDNSRSPIRCERNYQQMPNAGEVDVHINNGCYPGPYLDPKKISSLPSTYTGHIGVVLKDVLEDLIHCAHHQKTVCGFLKPGRGSIVISAVSDGMAYNLHLSNVDRVSTFWKVMEQFCDNLRCCSNLVSGFQLQSTCPQCDRGPLARKKGDVVKSSQKRPSTDQIEKPSCVSSTPDSTAANTLEFSSAKGFASLESPKRRRIYSAISQTATSPRTWSVDDVAKLVENTDLKDYVNLFRENDIDGKALLLLQRDIVINYMGLKIGPAVKLLDLIEDVKEMDARFS